MVYKICIFLLLLFSCKKKENFDAIQIIGHAGNGLNNSSSLYHDNSKESIELALSTNDCDGVEIDVQLSKDGDLWLYHDLTLESESNLSSCVNSLMSNELKNGNYKTFQKEKLIQINDLEANFLENKVVFLDLRHFNACENIFVNQKLICERIKEIKGKFSKADFFVMTNEESWIDMFYKENFQIIFSAETIEIASSLDLDKIYGFMFKNKAVEKKDVEFYQAKNKKILIFEVRSPKGIRSALQKHPDYVVTDDIRATLIEKYP